MNQYDIAVHIMRKSFNDKVDKAGSPYIEHLRRVEQSVPQYHLYTITALLHDLLEDCPEWNEKSLRVFFDDQIVDAIVAITKKPDQTYEDYINQVSLNHIASKVKIADLKDNMNVTRLPELTDKDIARLKKYHSAYQKLTYKPSLA